MPKKSAFTINGFNHVVLVTNDMEKTVQFYHGLLGLKVKATVASSRRPSGLLGNVRSDDKWNRLYFFDVGGGNSLAFAEFPGFDTRAESSYFRALWPGETIIVKRPQKMDHIALGVASRDELVAVQKKLRDAGYKTSDVQELGGSPFVMSIYVYDPNGVPLEIACWGGEDKRPEEWFVDPNPVPSLRD